MTLTQERATEPLTAAKAAGAPERWRAPSLEDNGAALDEQLLARWQNRIKSLGAGGVERTALLGLLLSQLEHLEFEQTAEVLGVRAVRLEKLMHGEEEVTKSLADKWEVLSNVLLMLQNVLRPEATWRWLTNESQQLGGMTPLAVIRKGRVDRLVLLTRSYNDTSFG